MEKNTNQRLTQPYSRFSDIRNFCWGFGSGMFILTGIGLLRQFPPLALYITGGLAGYHLLSGLIWPLAVLPFFYIVTTLGKFVFNTVMYVVLTVMYYTFFMLISAILRLSGKDYIAKISGQPAWIDCTEKENDPQGVTKLY